MWSWLCRDTRPEHSGTWPSQRAANRGCWRRRACLPCCASHFPPLTAQPRRRSPDRPSEDSLTTLRYLYCTNRFPSCACCEGPAQKGRATTCDASSIMPVSRSHCQPKSCSAEESERPANMQAQSNVPQHTTCPFLVCAASAPRLERTVLLKMPDTPQLSRHHGEPDLVLPCARKASLRDACPNFCVIPAPFLSLLAVALRALE